MARRPVRTALLAALAAALVNTAANAHDPVFGPGPHTLFQGGWEVHTGLHRERGRDERETEFEAELGYGLTADWVAGAAFPVKRIEEHGEQTTGAGDLALFTKYRFRRHDTLGAQDSAALLVKGIFGTGDDTGEPAVGTGSNDYVLGLTWGREGTKWYRWASVRYRVNGENDAGLRRGNPLLVDLAGGIRPEIGGYRDPDTVWMVELNGELVERAERNGRTLANTGGDEWFVSPGFMWTWRNFAVKGGLQIPVVRDRHDAESESDYRILLETEWHF